MVAAETAMVIAAEAGLVQPVAHNDVWDSVLVA